MKVLLTGGAGYLGTHTLVELLRERHEVVVLDNFSNSRPEALERVRLITQSPFTTVKADIRDAAAMTDLVGEYRPDVVVHLAGLKAVGESVSSPLSYYENNVQGSIALLKAMDAAGCGKMVFSSSATVYGEPKYVPHDEQHPLAPVNPYGRTKLFIEQIIQDWTKADPSRAAVLLRYFNPVGAHASGRIGEHPGGVPNNLMPFIAQVAGGKRDMLSIFGGDYDTRDGTGERDFIHVVDLARAHLAAVDFAGALKGCEAINVGRGTGVTVLELVHAFEAVSGRKVPYRIVDRRPGDASSSVADAGKALALLGWKAELGVEDMCRTAWRWQAENPDGFAEGEPG